MTITKDIAAKFAVAIVAVSMVLSAFAPVAKAQTTEDLQKMINDLLAQVAALQSQAGQGGSSTAAGVCPYTWTRDLAVGATGADVMKLQQFLNADADTRVAASGAGSVGMETEYFGPATAAAVSKMQVKYRADILSPSNLVNPTGYFGASSRAKANSLCVAAPVVTPGDEDATDEDEDDDSSVTLRGEASLDSFEMEDADDTDIQEGDEDAEIGVMTVEFVEGDASISRIDIVLDGGTSETRPWNVFEEVTLWVDGDKVATKSADSKTDYTGDANDGKLRFTGLDIVAMEEEELEIVIAATINSTVKGSETGEDWTVAVTAIRFFDADGVATTENAGEENTIDSDENTASFTIEEAGVNDEARIRKSTNNPDSSTLLVEDDTSKSDEFDIFVFDIDVEEDSSDLTLDDAKVNVVLTNPSTATTTITATGVISDVYLEIDGKRVKGDAPAGTNEGEMSHVVAINDTITVPYTFDFKGLDLESDERYTATLSVVFKGQNTFAAYQNGVKVKGTVTSTGWELEGINTSNALVGSQNGNEHTLATVVPIITGVTASISQANQTSNSGSIIFEFKLEADEDDVTITRAELDAAVSLAKPSGSDIVKGTPTFTKISGEATPSSNDFIVLEGDSATFRLTYTLTTTDAGDNGTYSMNLYTIAGEKVDKTSPSLTLAH